MNNRLNLNLYILLLGLIIFLVSCDNDTENHLSSSGENKVPLLFKEKDEVMAEYSYEEQNRLSAIDYIKGGMVTFRYEKNELSSLAFTYPEGIDGIRLIEFVPATNHKIAVKSYFPDNSVYYDTIYIDDKGFATEIYAGERSDSEKLSSIHYYFEYENEVLLKTERYRIQKESKIKDMAVFYEYDTKPGTASKINCPRWFPVFYNFIINKDITDIHLLHYKNNIIKKTTILDQSEFILMDIFQYNDDGYPVIQNGDSWKNEISIQYRKADNLN
jgi:hypothetical protein